MAIFTYQAIDLFNWLTSREDIIVLDVRNDKDFKSFHVESPYPFELMNISYYDFMEIEDECVARIPRGKNIRIVCAKEGSAKYVAEILDNHGFENVGYLTGGIKTWGNLLVPKLINPGMDYELYQFIRPGKASLSYGLLHNREIMFFDPSRAVDFYLAFAREKGCKITKTFETHLQADYISSSREIAVRSGAEFLGNDGDFKGSKNDYISLKDGEQHTFASGGPKVKVLFTPGHTPGSTSFIVDDTFMISGDMVFITSIGRPDLGGMAVEWAEMLFESMKMVTKLDAKLLILPGHYMNWEEANENLTFAMPFGTVKERNKDIYTISTLDDFITFIKDNMRPQPEEYAMIRQANANLEQFDDEKQEELDLGKNECAATAYAAAQREKEEKEAA